MDKAFGMACFLQNTMHFMKSIPAFSVQYYLFTGVQELYVRNLPIIVTGKCIFCILRV